MFSTKQDIIKWKIGYCFSGEYRNRIIIPSFNDNGDCSYFTIPAGNYNEGSIVVPEGTDEMTVSWPGDDWPNEVVVLIVAPNASSTEECFEGTSRAIFKFNMALDDIVLEPLAKGYNKLPSPIKTGTSNFTSNIGTLLS